MAGVAVSPVVHLVLNNNDRTLCRGADEVDPVEKLEVSKTVSVAVFMAVSFFCFPIPDQQKQGIGLEKKAVGGVINLLAAKIPNVDPERALLQQLRFHSFYVMGPEDDFVG